MTYGMPPSSFPMKAVLILKLTDLQQKFCVSDDANSLDRQQSSSTLSYVSATGVVAFLVIPVRDRPRNRIPARRGFDELEWIDGLIWACTPSVIVIIQFSPRFYEKSNKVFICIVLDIFTLSFNKYDL